MADPFYAEIRPFGFTFAPVNWAACDGTVINVQQNPAVYALIGNIYGGTAPNTFALPNLQGQAPIHWTTSSDPQPQSPGLTPIALGQKSGVESTTISSGQMPNHTHQMMVSSGSPTTQTAAPNTDNTSMPTRPFAPRVPPLTGYASFNAWQNNNTPDVTMSPYALTAACGSGGNALAHENRQPFLPVNFCMCVADGNWPPKPD